MSLVVDQTPEITMPPKLGVMLTQLADTSDLETALRRVITDYLQLKLAVLHARLRLFEEKWGMTFAQFANACEQDQLGDNPYAYNIESDFWEWEEAQTLLQHYEAIYQRWL